MAKIDRKWLADRRVAKHIVAISNELDQNLIVNGVETREQMAELHSVGVSCFQGTLIDRPRRSIDFISNWGQSSITALGDQLGQNLALRLAG